MYASKLHNNSLLPNSLTGFPFAPVAPFSPARPGWPACPLGPLGPASPLAPYWMGVDHHAPYNIDVAMSLTGLPTGPCLPSIPSAPCMYVYVQCICMHVRTYVYIINVYNTAYKYMCTCTCKQATQMLTAVPWGPGDPVSPVSPCAPCTVDSSI